MSSHHLSNHNDGSHYASSHFGRIIKVIVRRIRDFAARITRIRQEDVEK